MKQTTWLCVAVIMLGSGCIGSKSSQCGDLVCPGGTTCHRGIDPPRCASVAELVACEGRADGERCQVGERLTGHHCLGGMCIPGRCGDGVIDDGEQCDDGALNADLADACRTTCRLPYCGDAIHDASELCDDGNNQAGDGCSADCASLERCGNGRIDGGTPEQCDDGDWESLDGCSSGCTVETRGWIEHFGDTPVTRSEYDVAYDGQRGVVVLFGGRGGGAQGLDDTWEYDGSTWLPVATTTSPPARRNPAMTYDSARGVVVMFGGERSGRFNDTWEYDGVDWRELVTANAPTRRIHHEIAYDPVLDIVLLFGGRDPPAVTEMGDTWEYDGANWVEQSPAASPAPRHEFGMVFDGNRQRIIVVGGLPSLGASPNLWEYDGTTWIELGAGPDRARFGMAYDDARQRTVLFGGIAGGQFDLADTQEFDGTNWTTVTPTGSPPGRQRHNLAFHSASGRIVLFGGEAPSGSLGDTWLYDGTTWRESAPPTPRGRTTALVFDAARGVTVLFGGHTGPNTPDHDNETWELDGRAWRRIAPTTPPPVREEHAMAYDAARGVTVLFGGNQGSRCCGNTPTALGDLWEYDGTDWTELTPGGGPSARAEHAMAYHAGIGAVVLFGGWEGNDLAAYVGDTWLWDGTAWQSGPVAGPAPRRGSAMAYDADRGVIVLFGGFGGSYFGDTWEFDGASWADVSPTGDATPSARHTHTMAYDHAAQRVILMGGSIGGLQLADLWQFDGAQWSPIDTAGRQPAPRGGQGFAFDRWRRRFIVFGGWDAGAVLQQTWLLQFASSWPAEQCSGSEDIDRDGQIGCADVDCGIQLACTCGNGVCDGFETAAVCPVDCP